MVAGPPSSNVSPGSVYISVRRHDPTLPVVRLRRPTLTALAHAIEDEIDQRCERPLLFGGFQHERFLVDPLPRWRELAQRARACVVFAAATTDEPVVADPLRLVPLPAGAPMRDEWAVVAADEAFGVVLSAWEIPGQEGTRPRERTFEAVWTLEPGAVHRATRVCAAMAAAAGALEDDAIPDAAPSRTADARTLAEVVARVLTYVDGGRRG